MGKVLMYAMLVLGIIMGLVVVFVRAGEVGGLTGGQQAGLIMREGAHGTAGIIRAAMGMR